MERQDSLPIDSTATDPMNIMNSVMVKPYSEEIPMPHEWWVRRMAYLCDLLAERNIESKRMTFMADNGLGPDDMDRE